MLNLKTVKAQSIKAHLDRLQNTAEELATWSGGEVMAGRLNSSQECARLASSVLNLRGAIEAQAAVIRGREPGEN